MMSNNKINANFGIKKILNNESGMILLIASTFILMISIVVIGLINRNVTQALSSHEHYKQIQAEQLARGSWWILHEFLYKGGVGLPPNPAPVSNDGVTYTITFIDGGVDPINNRIHIYQVHVAY